MYSRTFYSNWMVEIQRFCGLCYCHQAVNFDQILLFDRIHLPLWREVVLRCLIEYMGERQEDLISVHHVCIGLKATCLFFCLYVLILWWYGVINYGCSWKIFKLCSLINSNVMTNQVQARTIALFYCNASFEPEKDNTHATIDHDSLVSTLYGIVM